MHTEKAIDSKNGGVFIDIQSIRQGSINDTAAQNEPKDSLTDCAEFIRTRKMNFIAGAVVAGMVQNTQMAQMTQMTQ